MNCEFFMEKLVVGGQNNIVKETVQQGYCIREKRIFHCRRAAMNVRDWTAVVEA